MPTAFARSAFEIRQSFCSKARMRRSRGSNCAVMDRSTVIIKVVGQYNQIFWEKQQIRNNISTNSVYPADAADIATDIAPDIANRTQAYDPSQRRIFHLPA